MGIGARLLGLLEQVGFFAWDAGGGQFLAASACRFAFAGAFAGVGMGVGGALSDRAGVWWFEGWVWGCVARALVGGCAGVGVGAVCVVEYGGFGAGGWGWVWRWLFVGAVPHKDFSNTLCAS